MLETAKAQMGFVPNLCATMVTSRGLLNISSRINSFRAESGFSAVEQEVVLLTINRSNVPALRSVPSVRTG